MSTAADPAPATGVLRHVVAVHGVGNPEPGSLLPGLMQALTVLRMLADRSAPVFLRVERIADGQRHLGVEVREGQNRLCMWDANWSDIEGAPDRRTGLFLFLIRLIVTMTRVAAAGWSEKGSGAALLAGRLYHFFFAAVALWIMAIPSAWMFLAIVQNRWVAGAFLAAIAGAILLAALVLRRVDRIAFVAGILWATAVAATGLWHVFHGAAIDAPASGWARLLQLGFTLLGPVLLLAAAGEAWVLRGMRGTVFFARMGMLVLSYALLAGVMALIWAANLTIAAGLVAEGPFTQPSASEEALRRWGAAYVCGLPYDVGWMELVTFLTTFAFGVMLLAGGFRWWIGMRRDTSRPTGAGLRDWISFCLRLLLALFAVVLVVLGLEVASRPFGDAGADCLQSGAGETLFRIYAGSALRLTPFALALFFKPVRIVLDVMADVLLYLPAPPGEAARPQGADAEPDDPDAAQGVERAGRAGIATGPKLRGRLAALVRSLAADRPAAIGIAAHSQGSRIAVDTLAEMRLPRDVPIRLATTGSPIRTLYGRFLDRADLPPRVEDTTLVWHNYWRPSDLVGGEIADQAGSVAPGDSAAAASRPALANWPTEHDIPDPQKQHHINYWSEPEVLRFLLDD